MSKELKEAINKGGVYEVYANGELYGKGSKYFSLTAKQWLEANGHKVTIKQKS